MPSIFDLMPASLWPVQPFIPPPDPAQPTTWPSWASGWTPAVPSPPPSWPTARADVPADADSSVSDWDRAMRQALAAQAGATRDPGTGGIASDRALADARRAHDFVRWMFGPPSAPQARQMGDAMLRGGSQYVAGAPRNVVAASADAPPSPVSAPAGDDANAQPPPSADQQAGLGAAVGNPNIERQGARIRATAATRPPPPAGGDDLAVTAATPNASLKPSTSEAPLPMIANPSGADAIDPWDPRLWKTLGMILGFLPLRAPEPTAPTPSYGVVAKTLPPSFRLPPPPLSDWQKPEPDMSWGSPYAIDLFKRTQAAGLDQAVLPSYAPGRERRDLARLSDFFLHGSGNFVSGDWDKITDTDVINFGQSLGTMLALGLLGPEGAAARAPAEAAEAAQAARAVALRGAQARLTGPIVGKLDPPSGLRVFPIEPPVRPAEPVVDSGDSGGGANAAAAASGLPRAPLAPAARVFPAPPIEPGGAELAGLPHVDPATVPLVPVDPPDPASALAAARLRGDIDMDALSARARQIHGALGARAQKHRTAAVLSTDGPTIIGGGKRDLDDVQTRLLQDGEIAAKLPGADAEPTVLFEAMARGHRPLALATSRPICPDCAELIKSMGGKLTSATTAIFPPQ